jgi:hypothetical protein
MERAEEFSSKGLPIAKVQQKGTQTLLPKSMSLHSDGTAIVG